jgi:low affinity Fe/Cu permease
VAAWFTRVATRTAELTGHYATFLIAVLGIIFWAATGPFFGFGATWQLVVNTATTIITFLMVFLIQHTQNRDTLAIHLKLDELIRATAEADDEMIRAEDDTTEELAALKARYAALVESHRALASRLGTGEETLQP